MGNSRRIAAVAAALGTVILAAGCGGSSSGSSSSGGKDFSKVTSAASGGGMAALVKAAKAEGTLNVIALPSNWANYGNIMKDFTAKYGIKITDANPEGSSQDEINAVQQEKGQSRAPDVLDMGTSFATEGQAKGLLAPYKVATWSDIPASSKSAQGDWYADYGGYVAIGYDPSKVKIPPTSFKSLLNPAYKHQVAINNNPTSAAAAFDAVWAAALANGGSFSNIAPGVTFFKKLHAEGNFVPVAAGPTTVENGSTPIVVWWDYLMASEIQSAVKGFKVVIPSDASFAAYYDQAISATAPHPAAARLWEEYLYSVTGQNLWLQGQARPIELSALVANGTVDKAAYAALPPSPSGTPTFPTDAQSTTAEGVVTQTWPSVIG
ncbi:MAG TPA: ABC transporter substrate-binding protein [Streptosporangiaceae bacterium]